MLANILPNWTVRYLADGLALTPPEGRALGGIRIRERQPLRSVRDIILWARGQMSGLEITVGPLEVFTTYEGEYAGIVTLLGSGEATSYQRTIGMVWGEDFYTQIDGGTDHLQNFGRFRTAVRDLVHLHSLGLGELRRRRFVYTPPPGWRAYARGLVTDWYSPGFPKVHGFISVFPARAGKDTPASQLDRVLHEMSWFGFNRETSKEPIEITAKEGLQGHCWRFVGRFGKGDRLFYDLVVLHGPRFHYALRLESKKHHLEEHRASFGQMVRSVERLPAPTKEDGSTAFAHWIS